MGKNRERNKVGGGGGVPWPWTRSQKPPKIMVTFKLELALC